MTADTPAYPDDWEDQVQALREDPTGDPVADARDIQTLEDLIAAWYIVRAYLNDTDGEHLDPIEYAQQVVDMVPDPTSGYELHAVDQAILILGTLATS